MIATETPKPGSLHPVVGASGSRLKISVDINAYVGKNTRMTKQRTYSIYDLKNGGQLLAALPWKDAKEIYKSSDDRLLAVYANRKGSPCVRWLSTGLDATIKESVEAIWELKAIRGDKPLNLPTK